MIRKILEQSLILALVPAFSLLSGCASLMAGQTEVIRFEAEEGSELVTISVEDKEYQVPCTVRLSREYPHMVTLSDSREIWIVRSFNGWVWGNVLLGGFIGLFVDAASGSINQNLEPDHLIFHADGSVTNGQNQTLVLPPPDQMEEWLEEKEREKKERERRQREHRRRARFRHAP